MSFGRAGSPRGRRPRGKIAAPQAPPGRARGHNARPWSPPRPSATGDPVLLHARLVPRQCHTDREPRRGSIRYTLLRAKTVTVGLGAAGMMGLLRWRGCRSRVTQPAPCPPSRRLCLGRTEWRGPLSRDTGPPCSSRRVRSTCTYNPLFTSAKGSYLGATVDEPAGAPCLARLAYQPPCEVTAPAQTGSHPGPGRGLPGGPVPCPPARCSQADAARAALPPCAARAAQPSTLPLCRLLRQGRRSPGAPLRWERSQAGCTRSQLSPRTALAARYPGRARRCGRPPNLAASWVTPLGGRRARTPVSHPRVSSGGRDPWRHKPLLRRWVLLEYLGHLGTDTRGRRVGDRDEHDGEADGDLCAGLQVAVMEQ
jgi:hypothetical protein